MLPKTGLQRKVAELSEKLPEISKEAVEWAYENALEKQVVQSRNHLFCLECGHKWKPEIQLEAAILGCTCPDCGQKLKPRNPGNSIYQDSAYVSILFVRGGFQVERMLLVSKQGKKLMKPVFIWHEVMQRYIDDTGKVTVMTIGVNGFGMAYDAWIYGTHMEIREAGSYKAELRHDLGPFRVCPGTRTLPIIRRNGFRGRFHDIAPHRLFSLILNDSKAETLLKSKQYALLKYYADETSYNMEKVKKHWPSIRICIRNGYKISDASIWLDYLELLEYFERDLRSSHYVCPISLKNAHDRYVKKKKRIEREKKLEKLKKRTAKEQKEFVKQKGKYFGLSFSDGNIIIRPLESVEEFMIEGDELEHCLFENEYYKRTDSLILSARVNEKPVETIEVSLTKLTVEQARGANNNPSKYHKQILSLMRDNMQLISQKSTKVAV